MCAPFARVISDCPVRGNDNSRARATFSRSAPGTATYSSSSPRPVHMRLPAQPAYRRVRALLGARSETGAVLHLEPAQKRVRGTTWSPLRNGCGHYLEPAQKRVRALLGARSEKRPQHRPKRPSAGGQSCALRASVHAQKPHGYWRFGDAILATPVFYGLFCGFRLPCTFCVFIVSRVH